MAQQAELVRTVMQALFSDVVLSQPLYCPEIKSEEGGERASDTLPLIYIWNENPSVGSCSISINGPIVGQTLEHFLARSDPSFIVIRNQILTTVREVAISSISNTCEKLGVLPSVAFSKDEYLKIIGEGR